MHERGENGECKCEMSHETGSVDRETARGYMVWRIVIRMLACIVHAAL